MLDLNCDHCGGPIRETAYTCALESASVVHDEAAGVRLTATAPMASASLCSACVARVRLDIQAADGRQRPTTKCRNCVFLQTLRGGEPFCARRTQNLAGFDVDAWHDLECLSYAPSSL